MLLKRLQNRSARLIVCLMLAEIVSMVGFSSFAVALVEFSALWQLDATQAGWISSAYFAGYVLAVPVLVGMTDRVDARKIYLIGSLLGVIGGVGFAYLAAGQASAMFFRALAGASLAGTYIPGLRILTERLSSQTRLRAVPYYTASFGIGVSLSFLLSGWIAQSAGWQRAFVVSGFSAALAPILMGIATAGVPKADAAPLTTPQRHSLDFRPVFANREALAYVLAYGGHCWELFALRAWLPAFLAFAWTHSQSGPAGTALAHWSTLIVLLGVPASILGAEVASQHGRRWLIRTIALTSVALGIISALIGEHAFGIVVLTVGAYHFAVMADSGALTTGALAASRPGEQGATLAVHSIVGFIGASLGPLVVGLGLTLGGGIARLDAWYLGFVGMVAGSALTAFAISYLPPQQTSRQDSPPYP